MSAPEAGALPASPLQDDEVRLPDGTRLALRRGPGADRPFLLVHGLASNARLWDAVGRRLVEHGHEVVAVDLRGHGRSDQVGEGHSTGQAAADLAAVASALDLAGDREPIAVGQSWGGNVVVTLAARHGGVAGLGLVDGGWIALGERYATFEQCWAELAPPEFTGVRLAQIEQRFRGWHADWPEESILGSLANFEELPDGTARSRLARANHRDILFSMWESDVRTEYARVHVPALLTPARAPGEDRSGLAAPQAAAELLPDAEISWYDGADHDLHAQQPDRLSADLVALAARVEARRP